MCEQGVCTKVEKYDLSKWKHASVKRQRIQIITLDFIRKYLTWKFPLKYYSRVDQCITLNFGSKKITGLAMISMTLENNFNWAADESDNFYINKVHSNCFLIFIGGKYVQVLDQVMEKVDTISRKIRLPPLGLFITEEKDDHKSLFPNVVVAKYPLVHMQSSFSVYQLLLILAKKIFSRLLTSSKFMLAQSRFKGLDSTFSVQATIAPILRSWLCSTMEQLVKIVKMSPLCHPIKHK